jgi:hypothetical protein
MLDFLQNIQNENKTKEPETLEDNIDLECEEIEIDDMEDILLELGDEIRYTVKKRLISNEE